MQPLVSIIIPTYNRAHLIGETLDSVLAQTYTNWECIVVDDGSTDDTDALLQKYVERDSRFQYHHRPKDRPKGANACRNYGFEVSKGEYLIYFDSDDLMISTCLEKRVEAIKGTSYDLVVFSMGRFENGTSLRDDPNRIVVNASLDETINLFLKGNLPWNCSRPIIKTKFIKKNNIKHNENLLRFQDVEFNIRLLKIGQAKYKSIDLTDIYYRLDRERINKLSFYKSVNKSFEVYFQSIFSIFSEEFKIENRKIFMFRFFTLIKNYYLKNIDSKYVTRTLILFQENLKLTKFEKNLFFMLILLNKYMLHKRGYYFFSQKVKFYLIDR